MTRDEYHSRKEMSSTMLRDLIRSPRLFQALHIDGTIQREPTEDMDFGTILHAVTLEGKQLGDVARMKPEGHDGRTKQGKEWLAENAGYKILSAADWKAAVACYDAAMKHAKAGPILRAEGLREEPIFWTDAETGVECRALLDLLGTVAGTMLIADVKTSKSANPADFSRSILRYGYHIQQGHYVDAGAERTGELLPFVFIVIQTEAPYICRTFELDEKAAIMGDVAVADGLRDYKRRLAANDWSEPNEDDVMVLSLPAWAN